jgi:acyl-CoA dehydrogenase
MDFALTKEQEDIRKAAREFAEKEFPEVALKCDEEEKFPRDLWKKACELGFVGVYLDEEYGGAGLGFLEECLVFEEFSRVDMGCGMVLLTAFGSEIIQKFGTKRQKEEYLPLIPSGKAIMGTAITEPDAGSDIFSATTTAVEDGNEYILNGNKMFITNGHIADFLLVFCLTDPDAAERTKRFSVFVVETDRKGFEANKLSGKMGVRASETSEIAFRDVRVPKANLIGEGEGNGFGEIMYLFNINRAIAGAQALGGAQGAFDKAVKYVKKRVQFGKPLSSFQGTQFKIADMISSIEASRALVYRACWLLDQGRFEPMYMSIAKLIAGEMAVRVTDEALQMHGGYGYFREYEIERFYRDIKIVEIYEGAKEIEKMTIAREVLGR